MDNFTITGLVNLADLSEDVEEVVSTQLLDWHLKGYLCLPYNINDYIIDELEIYIKSFKTPVNSNEYVKTHVVYYNHTPFAFTVESSDNTTHQTHIFNSEVLEDLNYIIAEHCESKYKEDECISFLDGNIIGDISHIFTNKDFKRRILKC